MGRIETVASRLVERTLTTEVVTLYQIEFFVFTATTIVYVYVIVDNFLLGIR